MKYKDDNLQPYSQIDTNGYQKLDKNQVFGIRTKTGEPFNQKLNLDEKDSSLYKRECFIYPEDYKEKQITHGYVEKNNGTIKDNICTNFDTFPVKNMHYDQQAKCYMRDQIDNQVHGYKKVIKDEKCNYLGGEPQIIDYSLYRR